MAKIDFKKQFKDLYSAKKDKIMVVRVPKMKFLMVDGTGAPEAADFQEAIAALYGTAYTLKFATKADPPAGYSDFAVPPLEALWWMDPGPFDPSAKEKWQWRAMLMQPDFVTKAIANRAIRTLGDKKPSPALDRLRLEPFSEGLCLQTLHVGPYDQVGTTIARLFAYIEENAYGLAGRHHEIYMSDPRRAAPERLKTIIRQPVSSRA